MNQPLNHFIAAVRRIEGELGILSNPKPEAYSLLEFQAGMALITYGRLIEPALATAFRNGAFAHPSFAGLSDTITAEDGERLVGLVRWLDDDRRAKERGYLVAGTDSARSPFTRLADAIESVALNEANAQNNLDDVAGQELGRRAVAALCDRMGSEPRLLWLKMFLDANPAASLRTIEEKAKAAKHELPRSSINTILGREKWINHPPRQRGRRTTSTDSTIMDESAAEGDDEF